jgi:hypothetical protein
MDNKASNIKEADEEVVLTPDEQLSQLISERTGDFTFEITHNDLKYIKNTLSQRVEWTGANEAYLIIISLLSINASLNKMDKKNEERVKISLPAATIESINFFFNKISGKGIDSAQRVFSVSMTLRPVLEKLKNLDNLINSFKTQVAVD